MRVGVYRGIRTIAVEDAPEPVARPSDVVVAVCACGICGSDLHTYLAGALVEPGQVLGHEFAGKVVEVGREVRGIAVGDRVTGVPIQPCGECRRCRDGLGHLCARMHERGIGFGIQGAVAERVRIPDARLGVNVHRSALRRRKAEELGVCVLAGPGEADAVLGGRGLEHVFECAGAPPLIQASLELVRPRGTVTVVALYEATTTIDPMTLLHKAATIVQCDKAATTKVMVSP